MKKFIIKAVLTPNNPDLHSTELQAQLQALGVTIFETLEEIDVQPVPENGREVWVYASSDESEPYYVVDHCGDYPDKDEESGSSLDLEQSKVVREQGVCTEFFVTYPRSDRYGVPVIAADETEAQSFVSYHFAIAPKFEISSEDCGDDTPEQYWFKVVLPADVKI